MSIYDIIQSGKGWWTYDDYIGGFKIRPKKALFIIIRLLLANQINLYWISCPKKSNGASSWINFSSSLDYHSSFTFGQQLSFWFLHVVVSSTIQLHHLEYRINFLSPNFALFLFTSGIFKMNNCIYYTHMNRINFVYFTQRGQIQTVGSIQLTLNN